MRRIATTLFVFACLLTFRPAQAATESQDVARAYRYARAAVVVPVEWDGIWANVDSLYNCGGALQNASTSTDTICGGKDFLPDTTGLPITFNCTGSATPTAFDMTCTGSEQVFLNCTASFTMVTHGTRSGDSDHIVSTITITFAGTGAGCSSLPPTCAQIDTWGTRTGPAPPAYCAIPTVKSTWGGIKARYR